MRRWPLTLLAISGVAVATHAAHALLGLGGAGSDELFNSWIYNGLILVSAGLCLARGIVVHEGRAPWLVLGAGLLSWFGGELYWTLWLDESSPFPSPADALYLGFYPAAYATLVLIAHERVREAGTCFDPAVVAAFTGILDSERAPGTDRAEAR